MTPHKLVKSGFYLSFATSAAFNIYGSVLATPNVIGWAFSALWSAFAFVAVEIMIKVKFPAKKRAWKWNRWNLVRFGGVGAVALISFGISYGHIFHSMISWNQGTFAAILAPFAVDGFLTLTSVTLMILPAPRKPRSKPAAKPARRLKAA